PESKMKSISVAEEETKEVDVDNIKEVVADKVDVEVPKPSKIEELAQKTYDEISAKVDEVIKNKEENKKENLINRINDTTKELSADIDKTFKNVADKVVDAFDNMEKETTSADEIIENKEDVKEDIVARTKKAIKEKEEKLIKEINPEDNIDIGVAIQSKELKDILEAPVADGQNLSPEELKKMYHQKLKNAVKTNNLQVEIIEE
ncbi:MAG: hypothetical protein IKA30_00125, partial [Alphaproteobacteria bacterium]|nr:hypothetical protein [Alphaproteobacteria bacterium]